MKTITLSTGKNGGKSTTLKLVYSLMLLEGFSQDDSPGCFWVIGPTEKLSYDLRVVLLWNGKRVGLLTRGDQPKALLHDLKHLEALGCEITVCASRNWKRWNVRKAYHETTEVQKTTYPTAKSMYQSNAVYARQILDLLKDSLMTGTP